MPCSRNVRRELVEIDDDLARLHRRAFHDIEPDVQPIHRADSPDVDAGGDGLAVRGARRAHIAEVRVVGAHRVEQHRAVQGLPVGVAKQRDRQTTGARLVEAAVQRLQSGSLNACS